MVIILSVYVAVYTAQVFAFNKTLVVVQLVPLKLLLKPQPSFQLRKLVSGVSVTVVMTLMLMLMLAQVNAIRSSHYQTLIKHSAVYRK